MKGRPKHILVIRLSAMGDVAMLVPVLRVLTTTYPNLKLTVLTREFFVPLFTGLTNVKVYPADVKGVHAGVIGLSSLAKELRDIEVEAVADVHNVLRSNILKGVFCFYGIPVIQIDKGRSQKKALTAGNNKVFQQLKTTHQRYVDVFSQLGYPIDLAQHQFPPNERLTSRIQNITGKKTKKWLGIAPFAQYTSKVYPVDLLENVLTALDLENDLGVLLFGGGKGEIEQLETLAASYRKVISVAGKLKLEEELALISNLDAMLSMDSANAHLAANYGIPVITLWGVTHPYAGFSAFGQPPENNLLPDLLKFPKIPTSVYGNKVPQGYEEVMRSISPQTIVEKIRTCLDGG